MRNARSKRRPVVAFIVLLTIVSAAHAEPPDRYVGGGVAIGGIDGYILTEGFVDGGVAIAGRWLWLRGRIAGGTVEDTEIGGSNAIASAMIGLEARGCVRFVCAVGGLDLGGLVQSDRSGLGPDGNLHLGLEVLLGDHVALRGALSFIPLPGITVGMLVRF
jgi:hypothetical protein